MATAGVSSYNFLGAIKGCGKPLTFIFTQAYMWELQQIVATHGL
jgi:hypothetical protein